MKQFRLISTILLIVCIGVQMVFAQEKPKVAVYATGGKSQSENKALSNKMTNALVGSGKYRTIERSDAFLEQVTAEQLKQRNGSIDDRQISQLGKQAGAEFVCIAEMVEAFGGHQISARIVNVETVEVTVSGEAYGVLNSMQAFDDITNNVIASMFGQPKQPVNTTATASAPVVNAVVNTPAVSPPATGKVAGITGTLVPGNNLSDKLTWLKTNAESHKSYILEANADESIAPNNTFEYEDVINITIVLRGVGTNRTIRLKSHGRMFMIKSNVTFILDNNITLQGHSGNNNAIIRVEKGTFKMNNGAIINGNDSRGVYVVGGIFEMNGGIISDNNINGVRIDGGTFTMNAGTISGNTASSGGGVYVGEGTLNMNGGTISGNTANNGGGVWLGSSSKGKGTSIFNMRGGNITGNTAKENGGGVYIDRASGIMGQVVVFNKTGGTITGYDSDQNNGNVVKATDNVLAGRGHAAFFDNKMSVYSKGKMLKKTTRKETTAGPKMNLSCNANNCSGAWDEK